MHEREIELLTEDLANNRVSPEMAAVELFSMLHADERHGSFETRDQPAVVVVPPPTYKNPLSEIFEHMQQFRKYGPYRFKGVLKPPNPQTEGQAAANKASAEAKRARRRERNLKAGSK